MLQHNNDLDRLAEYILRDFHQTAALPFAAIDIERLATEHLGLQLRYERLSDTGNILGLTAYQDTVLQLRRNGRPETLFLPKSTVLIEESLRQDRRKLGRRNFTIAHECAHQILMKLFPTQAAASFRRSVPTVQPCSLRHLKTAASWCEIQANQLAAALLMPVPLMQLVMFRFRSDKPLDVYGEDWLTGSDRQSSHDMAAFLGVSGESLLIRLKQLALVNFCPSKAYFEAAEADAFERSVRDHVQRQQHPRRFA